MKKKSLFYLVICIIGITLMMSAKVLDGRVSDTVDGTLMGIGAVFTSLGISRWCFYHWLKKEPAQWKQYEIESNDERNVAIRFKAKAVSGEVLQWIVIAAAWVAIFLDAPLWIILAAVGIFTFKTMIEMCLMAKYQKEM